MPRYYFAFSSDSNFPPALDIHLEIDERVGMKTGEKENGYFSSQNPSPHPSCFGMNNENLLFSHPFQYKYLFECRLVVVEK